VVRFVPQQGREGGAQRLPVEAEIGVVQVLEDSFARLGVARHAGVGKGLSCRRHAGVLDIRQRLVDAGVFVGVGQEAQ